MLRKKLEGDLGAILVLIFEMRGLRIGLFHRDCRIMYTLPKVVLVSARAEK